MAIITNTFQTFQARGIREDLSNVISNIAPEETPFQSNIGKESVRNTFFEWQQDDLAAPDLNNAQIEGDDVGTYDAIVPTIRVGNYTQITRKTIIIADTEEVVDKAGRRSEVAYQVSKKASELKRDHETIMLANQGASAGTTSTPRRTASLLAYLKTNTNIGATGANPTYTNIPTATRTDGTQRVFTEALLKDVIQKVWTQGGKTDMLMVGPVNKQRASTFAGIAQLRTETNKKTATIVGAADIYLSDFGSLSIVPNRFMRERDALLVDTQYASVASLRPYKVEDLAKTGDADKKMLIAEWGLKVLNEKAMGIIADLTTT